MTDEVSYYRDFKLELPLDNKDKKEEKVGYVIFPDGFPKFKLSEEFIEAHKITWGYDDILGVTDPEITFDSLKALVDAIIAHSNVSEDPLKA